MPAQDLRLGASTPADYSPSSDKPRHNYQTTSVLPSRSPRVWNGRFALPVAGAPVGRTEALVKMRRRTNTMRIRDLKVAMALVSALKPNARNPRSHSNSQLRQIAASIKAFGWTNPILIDGDKNVIAGHGRLKAANMLGLTQVPIIFINDMTEAQKRAYIIADNKLAENAGWDRKLLALELQDLLHMELDFDVTITGFEMGEIDVLINALEEEEDDDADQLPDADLSVPPVTQPGDLWQLGRHRLLCADATQPASFKTLLAGELAEIVFTDPPYNVPIEGHASGLGSTKHSSFAMASGEMSEAEFIAFLSKALGSLAAHSRDGAIHFVCMDWRHLFELLTAGRSVYSELKNLCTWVKTNGGMGSLYRSQHELVAVFKNGSAPHINNVELGRHGRHRTNVWTYRGMNSFGPERDEALSIHPTVKPVRLVEDAILDCSTRGGLVLDGFIGSGTTLIAAERAGRRGFGLECDPRYVDLTLRRFRAYTGIEPLHARTGLPFEETARTGPHALRRRMAREESFGGPLPRTNEEYS
jgi:DNA modification methylase